MARYDAERPRLQFDCVASANQVNGHARRRQYGARDNISTVAPEVIWTGPTSNYTGWLTAAEPVVVNSANVADDAAGLGAQTCSVTGLDENWAVASESISLVGGGASAATTTTFRRIYDFQVETVGANDASNVGVLTVTGDASGAVLAHMKADEGFAKMCVYTVPAGSIGLVALGSGYYESLKTLASLTVWVRGNLDIAGPPFGSRQIGQEVRGLAGGALLSVNLDGTLPVLPERTDIWAEALADTQVGNLDFWLSIKTIPK